MFDWAGGRKLFLGLLVIALTTIALFTRFLEPGPWIETMKWTLAIYIGGNAIKSIPDALARRKDD